MEFNVHVHSLRFAALFLDMVCIWTTKRMLIDVIDSEVNLQVYKYNSSQVPVKLKIKMKSNS